ncbi:Crp/Fnr family transcriptional regulator [Ulvibacter litoralis]|uniref:cAMP-binding domain of CRP or a regulatory subunit of cAMP-dependent protein kinases n=1 Tax=Ulvibacter litoralis TaxID=227084 RepID=A0A1G7EV06_9FLAO|nr:Crp/Fnr family transcriptional regulator [Ulvibacter litoralis]GHC53830.1 Crp/Fnr family transcriptional regulator [Ulvibacter litoralis]SDE67461.1 cAMP-binding domain of CRP or a regulatory subunit of cAMP-dependent protein kinases [Ulvibacter litoralis]
MITKFTFNSQNILSELPSEDKVLLEKIMTDKKYRKNQPIFTEGTLPSGIFYLQSGKVKKYKMDNDGREQIIYIYNAGEFFGYSSVLSESTYGDTAVAIENSIISFITIRDFNEILKSSSSFSRLLLKNLSHEFSVLANLMAVLSQRTVRERVALNLLILHDKYKVKDVPNTYIMLSRSDLANMAGTVIETLARVLHDFKHDKLIATDGRKIQLLNIERLIQIANFY